MTTQRTVCNACAQSPGAIFIRRIDDLRGIKSCGHRDGNGYVIETEELNALDRKR